MGTPPVAPARIRNMTTPATSRRPVRMLGMGLEAGEADMRSFKADTENANARLA